jgi:fatty acid amide hydrolase 2
MSHCVGSLPRCGIKADNDSEAVKLMRKAGAIPLLVSNTPELCLSWETTNLVTGRTLNPYNFLRTSGGSSGGEVTENACQQQLLQYWLMRPKYI